jgi:xylose isomerase
VKLNLEQNHAILAGHTFEHEIALAAALGVFGSLDINRGDYLLGWDTDQSAMNVPEVASMFEILKAGGLTTGG